MLKGKGSIAYTIFKIFLFVLGSISYKLFAGNPWDKPVIPHQTVFVFILIINSFFRQFYLYERERLYRYGKVSIILEFALGAYTATMPPVGPILLFLTPTIFESVAAHSLIFGGIVSAVTLIALMIIDTLEQLVWITNYFGFFLTIFVSYGMGFIYVFSISYLASLQFRERERVARVNQELEQAYKQLMDNAANLEELSVERERTRMAREIHDTLAHTLTAVVVQLEACKKLLDVDLSKAREEIEKAQESTRAGLGDVKRTIKALRPQILENSSLRGAINKLIQDVEDNTGVKVNFKENLFKEQELSASVEVALFRVIQESITNAIRHGEAERIDISITGCEGMVNIDISDNGSGCTHIKEGYGLKGVIERIKGLSGTINFYSTDGKGFRTQITIPYKGGSTSGN